MRNGQTSCGGYFKQVGLIPYAAPRPATSEYGLTTESSQGTVRGWKPKPIRISATEINTTAPARRPDVAWMLRFDRRAGTRLTSNAEGADEVCLGGPRNPR